MEMINKFLLNKTEKIKNVIVGLSLVSFFGWVTLTVFQGKYSSQFNIFFNQTNDFLADFLNVIGYSSQRDPYNCMLYTGLQEKAYPPMSYLICYPFTKLVNIDEYISNNFFLDMRIESKFLIVFIIITFLILILLYEIIKQILSNKSVRNKLFSLSLILSAPLLFMIERGNLLLLAFMFLLCFFAFYDSKNIILRELSYISLALSSSLKIAPAIYGVLLLKDKKYKEACRTIIYGLIFFILPFLFFNGGLRNIEYMIRNLSLQGNAYVCNENCSIYSLAVDYLFIKPSSELLIISRIVTLILCCISLFTAYKSNSNFLVLLSLSLIVILFPKNTGYYNTLYLFVPFIYLYKKINFSIEDILYLFGMLILNSCVFIVKFNGLLNYHLTIIISILIVTVSFIDELRKSVCCR